MKSKSMTETMPHCFLNTNTECFSLHLHKSSFPTGILKWTESIYFAELPLYWEKEDGACRQSPPNRGGTFVPCSAASCPAGVISHLSSGSKAIVAFWSLFSQSPAVREVQVWCQQKSSIVERCINIDINDGRRAEKMKQKMDQSD